MLNASLQSSQNDIPDTVVIGGRTLQMSCYDDVIPRCTIMQKIYSAMVLCFDRSAKYVLVALLSIMSLAFRVFKHIHALGNQTSVCYHMFFFKMNFILFQKVLL